MITNHLAHYFDPFDWEFIDPYFDSLFVHDVYGIEGYDAWSLDIESRYFDLSFLGSVLDITGCMDSGLL